MDFRLRALEPFSTTKTFGTTFNRVTTWIGMISTATNCDAGILIDDIHNRPMLSYNFKEPEDWLPFFSTKFLAKHGPPSPICRSLHCVSVQIIVTSYLSWQTPIHR
jgi:hypothetical protein